MPGSTTRHKTRSRDSVNFNRLSFLPFEAIASIPLGTAVTTVLDKFVLPCSCKIIGAAAYSSNVINPNGTYSFNIVAGTGSYETTAGVRASDFVTIGGTIHTGDVITLTFTVPNALMAKNGVATTTIGFGQGINPAPGNQIIKFSYTVKSTDTTTSVAAQSMAAAFNANQSTVIHDVFYAWNVAGAIIDFTALQAGTLQNSITLTAAVTGTAHTTTATVSALNFSGGIAPTGMVPAVNDQSEFIGVFNYAPAGSGTLGATAIFNADMPLFPPSVGNNVYWSSNFDVLYQQGTTMTLRANVPFSAPLTNFKVKIMVVPADTNPAAPLMNSFDPHQDIR